MADPNTPSRLVEVEAKPSTVYLEALMFFMGANFLFHQNIFRKAGNSYHFAGFMLINAWTSYQVAEATNYAVIRRYATMYNNTLEMQHRAELNKRLRQRLYQ